MEIVYKKLTEAELETFNDMRMSQLTEEYESERKEVPKNLDLKSALFDYYHKRIREYVELTTKGDASLQERYEIINKFLLVKLYQKRYFQNYQYFTFMKYKTGREQKMKNTLVAYFSATGTTAAASGKR